MNIKPSEGKDLREAWSRFLDNSYTCEDLSLILDSLKEDGEFREFYEASDRAWDMAISDMPSETEERKEAYRREAAQLLAEYENKQQLRMKPIACGDPFRVHSRKSGRIRKIFYAAAAAAIMLGVLIPAARHYLKPKTEQAAVVQYVEAVTHRGEIKTVVLHDNTKVTLNAESRIIYPAIFTGAERSVELSGEALFEVVSDPDKPFTVTTENMKISVLGTVFCVKEYANDGLVTVSVASGKVEVDLAGGKALLEKNQQVKMNKTTEDFEKWTIDVDKYLSWTDGTLYFHRTPLREVVNMLNRHYPQVEIELAEGEYPNLISGEHDNRRVEAVLTSIVYTTGLKCKIKGNKYTLYK